ncbi:hypothetical protein ACRE_045600 [Hapsidospora chrysogenum ATCC 11550]|uniref:Uncharacterized protein n=1 Tax=Hapsidospora chrysogenum (strain ATCC 11550 / CBS 779.69 / DSM 880 / IAM 14645 / JCM 23072 / IMI 49137) TaxID=857340 RepID=A0A086T5J6_HAPC1|nr:hypothetical protein ACRE_045600 [Hapsidospora chrysogenum ATCC 11550]
MGFSLRDMQPSSLYITIATPPLAPYQPVPADAYHPYRLDDDFDPREYETSVADGHGREEFAWGLYWLHDHQRGTWYTLRRQPNDHNDGSGGRPSSSPSHVLTMATIPPSALRLNNNIVGLVRVLSSSTPAGGSGIDHPVTDEIPAYLHWLTARAAPAATRTFIWATTAYMRCRRHLAHVYAGGEDDDAAHYSEGEAGVRRFEINKFLEEALGFAYGEVSYGLIGGQLPRPVMASEFGVELQLVEEREGPVGGKDWAGEGDWPPLGSTVNNPISL